MQTKFGAAATVQQVQRVHELAARMYGSEIADRVRKKGTFFKEVMNGTQPEVEATRAEVRKDSVILAKNRREAKQANPALQQFDAFYHWQFPSEELAIRGEKMAKEHKRAARWLTGSHIRRDGNDVLMYWKVPYTIPAMIRGFITGLMGK